MIQCNSVGVRTPTVSYTHLDVYKRQVYNNSIVNFLIHFSYNQMLQQYSNLFVYNIAPTKQKLIFGKLSRRSKNNFQGFRNMRNLVAKHNIIHINWNRFLESTDLLAFKIQLNFLNANSRLKPKFKLKTIEITQCEFFKSYRPTRIYRYFLKIVYTWQTLKVFKSVLNIKLSKIINYDCTQNISDIYQLNKLRI